MRVQLWGMWEVRKRGRDHSQIDCMLHAYKEGEVRWEGEDEGEGAGDGGGEGEGVRE